MISSKIKALEIATNLFLNEKCPFPGDEGVWNVNCEKHIYWNKRTFQDFLELANGLENFLNTSPQNTLHDN